MILGQVFERFVEESPVWIADRNFCTLNFLSGIVARKGYFIIREHQCFPWYDASEFRQIGSVEGGTVFGVSQSH